MGLNLTPEEIQKVKNLHSQLDVQVARFSPAIKRHNKFDFIGYTDLRLVGRPGTLLDGFNLFLPGIEVKNLRQSRGYVLDFPSKRGKGDRQNSFFNVFAPGSKITRHLLEVLTSRHPEIKTAWAQCMAEELPKPQNAYSPAPAGGTENLKAQAIQQLLAVLGGQPQQPTPPAPQPGQPQVGTAPVVDDIPF